MARIAFVQNKLGKTDGVSLEVDKWRAVCERMGHGVLYCAGNDDVPGIHTIPELSLFHPAIRKILENGTVALKDYDSEQQLAADIDSQERVIRRKLMEFIDKESVDVLVPNNLLSIGYNVPTVPALANVIRETGLPTIVHSHDFYFEESGETNATCQTVLDIFEQFAPPPYPNVRHVVINRLARAALAERKGIEARVVPNVWDFGQQPWVPDEYNADFREAFGIGPDDIVFLQATRVLDRKAIELAIDVVGFVQRPEHIQRLRDRPLYDGRRFGPDNRIVLLCAGYIEQFGITGSYVENLKARAAERGVDLRFIGDRVGHNRGRAEDGAKTYSLWDSYVHADFVTYPSIWEGWGNQFIEAVFAKLPVVIFEYPVYVSDLKPVGFDVVTLGDELTGRDDRGLVRVSQERLDAAASEVVELLTDAKRRTEATEHNFRVGRENFSYEQLERIVRELLEDLGVRD